MSNNYKKRVNNAVQSKQNVQHEKMFKHKKGQNAKTIMAYILALFMFMWTVCSVFGVIGFVRSGKKSNTVVASAAGEVDDVSPLVTIPAGSTYQFPENFYANPYISDSYLDLTFLVVNSSNGWIVNRMIFGSASVDTLVFDTTLVYNGTTWVQGYVPVIKFIHDTYIYNRGDADIWKGLLKELIELDSGIVDGPPNGLPSVNYSSNVVPEYDYNFQYNKRNNGDNVDVAFNYSIFPYYGLLGEDFEFYDNVYVEFMRSGVFIDVNNYAISLNGVSSADVEFILNSVNYKGFKLDNGVMYYLNCFADCPYFIFEYTDLAGQVHTVTSGQSFQWLNVYKNAKLLIRIPAGESVNAVIYPMISRVQTDNFIYPLSYGYYNGFKRAFDTAYSDGYNAALETFYGSYIASSSIYYQAVSYAVDGDSGDTLYYSYERPLALRYIPGGVDFTNDLAYYDELWSPNPGTEYNGQVRIILSLAEPISVERLVYLLYGYQLPNVGFLNSVKLYSSAFDENNQAFADTRPWVYLPSDTFSVYPYDTNYFYQSAMVPSEYTGMISTIVVEFDYVAGNNYVLKDLQWEGYAIYESAEYIGYQKAVEELKDNNAMYNQGYTAGYRIGYTKGIEETETSPYTFKALLTSVIDVPVTVFTSLFDFNVLGVNLTQFFLSLLSVCFVLVIVKLLL